MEACAETWLRAYLYAYQGHTLLRRTHYSAHATYAGFASLLPVPSSPNGNVLDVPKGPCIVTRAFHAIGTH